jgi:peptidoglycan/xylan/chitin deacetylase (PgdA/CDA1 family)
MNGIFTISLDFELHWGGFEKWNLQNAGSGVDYETYFLNTRRIIPKMLALFQEYEIHVTWAAVGMLLHESKDELLKNAPANKPSYKVSNLSAYHYINVIGIGEDEEGDPFHFAPSLVRKILATPHQELGTHTFAHFYCNEEGQTIDQFQEDLKAAKRIADKYGSTLRSLVFPRNQFNDAYLKTCFDEGIKAVRSNPLDWYWKIESTQHESFWKRLNRGADAYLPGKVKNTYALKTVNVRSGYPVCIPASRLLRPYRASELFLNDLKIARIKSEISHAAKNNEVYHLWWHPHNFGNYPEQNLQGLKKILDHFAGCKKKWNIQSLNMREITSLLQNGN